MIYSASKGMYTAVLLGEKTLTTRLKLPAHIAVGKVWAIVPKRAAPAWWIRTLGASEIVAQPRQYVAEITQQNVQRMSDSDIPYNLKSWGFVQARIRIDDFWETPLGNMTEQEARDEGVASVHDYARLWTAINPDYEWWSHLDLPVYRIRFSVPLDVAQAVSRVGKQAILDAAKGMVTA